MHKHLIILITLLFAGGLCLQADISVRLNNENANRTLATRLLEGREYVALDDLNSLLGAVTKQEFSDNRTHLFIFGEQFIILPDSAHYTFHEGVYSFHFPMLSSGGKLFLPVAFMLERLPSHFPERIKHQDGVLYVTKPKDKSVKCIVLDPGHGGKDPGAVGKNGTREKDINLAVAFKLKRLLEEELGVTVLMTRGDDRFVSLGNRTRFANENHADIFVCIHTNASTSRNAKGMETFFLSTAMTSDERAVEALENNVVELYEGKAEKQKYDDLAFILSDLSQTEHLENSSNLATFVHHNMVTGTGSCDRGIKQANFYVLRGAFMPSILVEMGFISNPQEESLLKVSEYQDRLALTIFEGIKRFKSHYDRIRAI